MDKHIGLGAVLFNERGGGYGFVCIWRQTGDALDDGTEHARHDTSVGEFLSRPENQCGTWRIDGGWGGPPGPVEVEWCDHCRRWINGGFLGHLLEARRCHT